MKNYVFFQHFTIANTHIIYYPFSLFHFDSEDCFEFYTSVCVDQMEPS